MTVERLEWWGQRWGEDHHSPNRPPPHHFPVNISQDTLGMTGTHWDTADQQYSQLMIVWLGPQLSDHFMRNSWLLTNTYALEPLKISNISSLIAYTRLPPVNPYYPSLPCLKVSYIFMWEVFKILKRRCWSRSLWGFSSFCGWVNTSNYFIQIHICVEIINSVLDTNISWELNTKTRHKFFFFLLLFLVFCGR